MEQQPQGGPETFPAAGRLLVEVHVEEDDRGRLLLEGLGNGPGIALGPHPVALLLEQQAGGDEDVLVVVDYEDERGGLRHECRSQVYASGHPVYRQRTAATRPVTRAVFFIPLFSKELGDIARILLRRH